MKVLQIISNLGAGGAEKLLKDLTIELKKENLDVEIAVLQKEKSIFIDELEKKKIKVHKLSKNNLYSVKNFFRLFKLIKKQKYDVIHVHLFPTFYFVGVISLFFPKIKFVYTEHNTFNRRRKYKLLKFIEIFMYSRYQKIICISEQVEKNLRFYLKNFSRKILTIENGININIYKNADKIDRKELNISLNVKDVLIVMVASFTEQKDQYTLIKSLEYLPEKYKLILIGDGILRFKIENLIKELKLEKRVFLLGIRKDVPSILKSCDIGVLSSNWEGFGLVAIEKMAAGLPVFATNVEGLREVINNSEQLFEVKDDKKLADKIKEINENKIKYELIKEKQNDNIKKYSIENMANKYKNVFNNLKN